MMDKVGWALISMDFWNIRECLMTSSSSRWRLDRKREQWVSERELRVKGEKRVNAGVEAYV